MASNDYWRILEKLEIVTIVCVASRPGSDLIQSLFDSHPEIISIDGDLDFYDFYMNAYSIWGTNCRLNHRKKIQKIDYNDLLNEFVYKNIDKFKSEYDNLDSKNTANTEISKFIKYGETLLNRAEFNAKNLFLAIYGAYCLARGNDLKTKTHLIHHAHAIEKLHFLEKEFDSYKVIAANRDPRSSYLSMLVALNKLDGFEINHSIHNIILKRVFHGRSLLKNSSKQKIKVSCLEELHANPKQYLESICDWLNINLDDCLFQSTWNGNPWYGDSLSDDIKTTFNTNFHSANIIKWKKKLNIVDKILISALNRDEIKAYKYDLSFTSPLLLYLTFLLILIPNKIEFKILKKIIYNFEVINYCRWQFYLFARYYFMYKKLFTIIFKTNKILKKV